MILGSAEPARFVFSGLLVLALAAALGACRDQAPVDRMTVESRDGVRIVRNPAEPLEPRSAPALEEELAIGGDPGSDGRMLFKTILPSGSLDVDSSGNLYVADPEICQVVAVDPQGRWLRNFGRNGQGPGEFQRPAAVKVLADGQVAVYDTTNMRLSFFSSDGRLVRELSLHAISRLWAAQIDSRGDLFGLATSLEGRFRTWILTRVSADATNVARIASWSGRFRPTPGRIRLFTSTLEFRLTTRDEVAWGQREEYAIHIADNDGRLRAIVKKDHQPVPVTARDIEDEMDRRFGPGVRPPDERPLAPSHFPAWSALIVADDGRLFVQTREPAAGGARVVFDVFSDRGSYLYRLPLPGTPLLIVRNRLYTREESDDGAILIKRYVMK